MPEIGEILREGKGKKVYATDDPDKAIVFFKDEAMAFHGLKRGRILGKGEVNNAVCARLFSLLAANGIESHFIEMIDARHSLVKRCDMLPFTVRIRNRVAGQLAERTRLPVGQKLDPPVVEYVMRDTDMEVDPVINHTHIYAMKAATPEEMAQIDSTCVKVNELLTNFLKKNSRRSCLCEAVFDIHSCLMRKPETHLRF